MPIFGKDKKEERPVIELLSSGRWDAPLASVIASPTDEIILIRDGEVIDTFTEEKLQAREGVGGTLRAMIGAGREVTVLRVDLRPFKVEMSFGEHPPPVNAQPIRYAAPDSTGEHASMGIVLEVVVDPDEASKAMWLSGTETLTGSEIQDHLTPQIFAAIQPIIAGSEISTLRTTEGVISLETEMREKLRDEAEYYGLLVRDLSVIWGASERRRAQAEGEQEEPQTATPGRSAQPSARQETREPIFDKPFPPPSAKPATDWDSTMPQTVRKPKSVSFASAIALGFKRYFDFSGRSSRSEFWWWCLFTVFIGLIPFASLITLIPSLAVNVRRLHDINRSGWWLLLLFGLGFLIIPLVVWFVWMVKQSDKYNNRWGPPNRRR